MNYAVVCLSKNREWIAERWVTSWLKQSVVPFVVIQFVNRTKDIPKFLPIGSSWIGLWPYGANEIGWERGVTPALESSESMARLRNVMVNKTFLHYPEIDAVISCDSDVLIDPDGAQKLLNALQVDNPFDLVCGPVRNGDAVYDVHMNHDEEVATHRLRSDLLTGDLYRCFSGGACVAISGRAWEKGLRYGPHVQCENVGLAFNALRLGLRYGVHTGVRTHHWMTKEKGLDSHE